MEEKTDTVGRNLLVLRNMLGTPLERRDYKDGKEWFRVAASEYDAIRHHLDKIIGQVYEEEGFLVWRVRRIEKLGRHISGIAAELEEMSREGLGEGEKR